MDFYISSCGDDVFSGTTLELAWQSLDRASDHRFQPGDRLLLEGGVTHHGTLRVNGPGVQISSFGSGAALVSAGEFDGIVIENGSNCVISNIKITGAWNTYLQSGSIGTGLLVRQIANSGHTEGPRIEAVSSSGFRNGGICVAGSESKSGFDSIVIENCIANENGSVGIVVSGTMDPNSEEYSHRGVTIRGCQAHRNRGISNIGCHSGSGIVVSDCMNVVIENCLASENGENSNDLKGGPVGIWAWDCDHVVIQHCESHHNRSMTGDGGGFDLDGGCTNSVMQYNYSHDNAGPGFLIAQFPDARPLRGCVVRFNLSINDGRNGDASGIFVWDGNGKLDHCDCHNNTIILNGVVGKAASCYCSISPTKNIRLLNNLFIAGAGVRYLVLPEKQEQMYVNHNLYIGSNSFSALHCNQEWDDFGLWQDEIGYDSHSMYLDLDIPERIFLAPECSGKQLIKWIKEFTTWLGIMPSLEGFQGIATKNLGERDFIGNPINVALVRPGAVEW
ncbi:MAG: right-handed parallel beta-helix repeat-containing protein [Armatimonadetes bacterium]|nr:right-handed parallel beta-helix repeat-containing protein [Armatimonadota bacterium]